MQRNLGGEGASKGRFPRPFWMDFFQTASEPPLFPRSEVFQKIIKNGPEKCPKGTSLTSILKKL